MFEEWGWRYNYATRTWTNHTGRVDLSLDFVVKLTSEPEGDIRLMAAIVQFGTRRAEA